MAIRDWLRPRILGGHGVDRLPDDGIADELTRCVREIRRRNLRRLVDDLTELMLQPADVEHDPEWRKRFAEATESLLTELQPYEADPARHGVWRSPRRRTRTAGSAPADL